MDGREEGELSVSACTNVDERRDADGVASVVNIASQLGIVGRPDSRRSKLRCVCIKGY